VTQIFLNYRIDDEPFGVELLDRDLTARFGDDVVFFASRSIPLGDEWERRMFDAIDESAAVLVVIGRNWLDARGADGTRRLDDPADFVRREIRAALDRDKQVVPVRLDVPRLRAEQLPEALHGLAGRQDVEIRRRKAKIDIDDLATRLSWEIPALRKTPPTAATPAVNGRSVTAEKVGNVYQGDFTVQTFQAGTTFN
jgi:hypothetical protein